MLIDCCIYAHSHIGLPFDDHVLYFESSLANHIMALSCHCITASLNHCIIASLCDCNITSPSMQVSFDLARAPFAEMKPR